MERIEKWEASTSTVFHALKFEGKTVGALYHFIDVPNKIFKK